MYLVDEENDFVFEFRRFFDDLLHADFEFTTVFGTSDETGHIEYEESLMLHGKWHFTSRDAASKSFHDGSFTDTRITGENGIILGFTIQYRDKPIDFFFTSNDGVYFSISRFFCDISTEEVECGRLALLLFLVGLGLPHLIKHRILLDIFHRDAAHESLFEDIHDLAEVTCIASLMSVCPIHLYQFSFEIPDINADEIQKIHEPRVILFDECQEEIFDTDDFLLKTRCDFHA